MRTIVVIAIALGVAGPAWADDTGRITGKVKLPSKTDVTNVYVYLKGTKLPRTVPKEAKAVRQKNKQFGPRVMAVVRGTTVDFPNEDRIMHNVYSRSPSNTFDLGHYKKGTSKSVTFNKGGVVDIYCNIHPDMAATVLVVENDFLAPIAADGTFELKNVPPGTYEVVAWMPSSAPATKSIEVKTGAATVVALELSAPAPATDHLNKEGQPYGRYK